MSGEREGTGEVVIRCSWSVEMEGDEKLLEVLHLSTSPDNHSFVDAAIRGGVLRARSPSESIFTSLNALEDYLAHLKLALKVFKGLK